MIQLLTELLILGILLYIAIRGYWHLLKNNKSPNDEKSCHAEDDKCCLCHQQEQPEENQGPPARMPWEYVDPITCIKEGRQFEWNTGTKIIASFEIYTGYWSLIPGIGIKWDDERALDLEWLCFSLSFYFYDYE